MLSYLNLELCHLIAQGKEDINSETFIPSNSEEFFYEKIIKELNQRKKEKKHL